MRQSKRSQRETFPSHGTSTSRVGPGRCSNQQKPPCDLQGPEIGSAGGGVKGFFGGQRQKSANGPTPECHRARLPCSDLAPFCWPTPPSRTSATHRLGQALLQRHVSHAITFVFPEQPPLGRPMLIRPFGCISLYSLAGSGLPSLGSCANTAGYRDAIGEAPRGDGAALSSACEARKFAFGRQGGEVHGGFEHG